jgi:ribosome-binding factor A
VSHRHEQLEATLKRAVQQVVARGLQDPRAEGTMITVTGLTISRDLKNSTVLVTIYPEERQKLAMHAIRHATSHIRHEASELVAMKQMPQMVFELDAALKQQTKVLDALRKVEQERQRRTAENPTPLSTPAPHEGNNPTEARQP